MTKRIRTALLVLEDGKVFKGVPFGKVGSTLGEIVFATGMSGYQETLTDPSYAGQIVVQTAPHIGNTGIKRSTIENMVERGLDVEVFPATASSEVLLSGNPDAVFYSNGPGDPETATAQVEVLQEVLRKNIPFFGICFGNQLLGRALGFQTYKLAFGHRGINQPVLDRRTGKVEVTAHNHGFAVRVDDGEEQPSDNHD
jgi:carbamoyl-phosphate synthase small subunit